MALYFEYSTDLVGPEASKVISTAWSNSDHPLLAVSKSDGSITMLNEEAERLDYNITFER
jgi:hypothetical protein